MTKHIFLILYNSDVINNVHKFYKVFSNIFFTFLLMLARDNYLQEYSEPKCRK